MSALTLFNIAVTILVYIGAKALSKRVSTPFATPVLTATIVLIILFQISDISYQQYTPAKEWMTYLLGPATVALALPMYKNRQVIKARYKQALLGLIVGSLATITSAIWISQLFHLPETIQASSAVKAVTTPVAIETVVIIGGDPTLAAAFVIIAGILGAVFGPICLSLVNIHDPFARGLGIGTVSHGIGTSQAVMEGELQGAVSSVAMGAAAILTAIILPWIYPLF